MRVTYNAEYPQRIRLAAIGCGGHAQRNIFPTFQFAPIDFVAICDVDRGKAEECARVWNVPTIYADYQKINETPGVTPGLPMGLPENATTVRVEGGKTLTTDGPFVGMKEAVGGWFILEADDLDAAIEVAARVPAARYGGAVEIRPSEVYW